MPIPGFDLASALSWALPGGALAQAQPGGMREIIDNLARTPLSEVVIFVAVCTVIRLAIGPFLRNTPVHKRSGFYAVLSFVNELLDAIVYAGVFVFMLIRPFAMQAFLIPSGSMVPTLLVNDFIVANKWVYRTTDPKVGDIVVFRPPQGALFPGQWDPVAREPRVDFIKRCLGVPGEVIEIRDGKLFRNGKEDPDRFKHFSMQTSQTTFQEITDGSVQMKNFKLVKYEGPYEPWRGKTIPVLSETSGPDSLPNYLTEISSQYAVGADAVVEGDAVVRSWKPITALTPEELERIEYLRDAPPAPIPPGYYLMVGDNRNNSFDGRGWGLVPRDSIVGKSEFIWLPFSRWGRTR